MRRGTDLFAMHPLHVGNGGWVAELRAQVTGPGFPESAQPTHCSVHCAFCPVSTSSVILRGEDTEEVWICSRHVTTYKYNIRSELRKTI